jgi:hypothetical protein
MLRRRAGMAICHSNRLTLLLLLLFDVVWVCKLQPHYTLPQPQRIAAAG